jgi:hypothetical protein
MRSRTIATSYSPKPSCSILRGEAWWPNKDFERDYIQPEQEARYEADAWEQAIRKYLDGLGNNRKKTTILDVAVHALQFEQQNQTQNLVLGARGTPINRLSTTDQRRITAIMTKLNWVPKRDKHDRWWEPATT